MLRGHSARSTCGDKQKQTKMDQLTGLAHPRWRPNSLVQDVFPVAVFDCTPLLEKEGFLEFDLLQHAISGQLGPGLMWARSFEVGTFYF